MLGLRTPHLTGFVSEGDDVSIARDVSNQVETHSLEWRVTRIEKQLAELIGGVVHSNDINRKNGEALDTILRHFGLIERVDESNG